VVLLPLIAPPPLEFMETTMIKNIQTMMIIRTTMIRDAKDITKKDTTRMMTIKMMMMTTNNMTMMTTNNMTMMTTNNPDHHLLLLFLLLLLFNIIYLP